MGNEFVSQSAVAVALLMLSSCTTARTPLADATTATTANEPPPATVAPEPGDPNELSPALLALDLTPQQRTAIVALRADMRGEVAGVRAAGMTWLRTAANDVRRCRGDSASIAVAAERVINVANNARGPLLNSIDELHAILTPSQRYQLARRMLEDDENEKRKRKSGDDSAQSKQNERAVRSYSDRMDLSVSQMLKLLLRLQAVRSDFEDQLTPWRKRYRSALRAFVREDFVAREQAIARAPAAQMLVGSARKALRVAVPLLEPAQCEEAAAIMRETADKPRAAARLNPVAAERR